MRELYGPVDKEGWISRKTVHTFLKSLLLVDFCLSPNLQANPRLWMGDGQTLSLSD